MPAPNMEGGGAIGSREHNGWCYSSFFAISLVCWLIQPADKKVECVVPNVIIDDCEGVLAFILL